MPADDETKEAPELSPATPASELDLLVKNWHMIVERTGKLATLAKANLVDAMPVKTSADKVTIAFDPEFAEHMEQAGMQRNRAALQKTLSDFLRRPVSAEFITSRIGKNGNTMKNNSSPEMPAPAPAATKSSTATPQAKHKWLANEAVRKTIDLFDGRIVDIRE
jgi:hypothetical protein